MSGSNRTVVIAAAALALMWVADAHAQASEIHRHLPEVRGYALVGAVSHDLGGINTALAGQEFESLDETVASLGGGIHVLLGRWIVGAEGFGLFPRESTRAGDAWRARLMGGGGVFNVGYVMVQAGGVTLYPIVGIGGGGLTLQMEDRSFPTFDEVLADPGRSSIMTTMSMIVQPAIGVDHLIPFGREVEGVVPGLLLGIRFGYTFTPLNSDWYRHRSRIPGGPSQGMEGGFVRIMIGGGHRPPTRPER
jgi:hypothetical protein